MDGGPGQAMTYRANLPRTAVLLMKRGKMKAALQPTSLNAPLPLLLNLTDAGLSHSLRTHRGQYDDDDTETGPALSSETQPTVRRKRSGKQLEAGGYDLSRAAAETVAGSDPAEDCAAPPVHIRVQRRCST